MICRRNAFTLFELILAIALSAALLALIGMAINLYLTRVANSRDRVEEAQLARSILSMIADDLRATAIYQPQDVTDVAQLMAQSTTFDVDSIDAARSGSTGGTSSSGTTGGISSLTAGAGGGATGLTSPGGSGGTTGSGSTGASSGSGLTSGAADYESEMPLGINGAISELYVDIERLPGGDELFGTLTGYTNAPMAVPTDGPQTASGPSWGTTPSPSDLKTVRYFIREGDRSEGTGVAATSLDPALQGYAGGLVRQEIPRPARMFAEQNGNSAVLESGQVLIAPEVVHIEFRYFDGQQTLELWDMVEAGSLPLAIEVRIWLTTAHEAADSAAYDAQGLLSIAREYRQTVFLPMAELSQSGAAGGMSGSSSSSSSTSSSTTGSSTTGSSTSSSSSSFGTGTN
jgi:type II secretory pathway pseudopilin PulG